MRQMKIGIAVGFAFIFATVSAHAQFAGEWADKNFHGNSVFQLGLEQTGSDVSVFFSANRKDGGGAAPEADGKGKVSGGTVQFTWSDSFNNSGTGTIKR